MINAINKKFNHKPESVSIETWRLRNDLIVENNILKTSSGKMFVPYKMRLKVLTIGHGIHHGINQTIERLKSKFFWPNLRTEVKNFIENCRTCALVRPKFLPSSSTPILTKAPMEVVACDFIGPLPSDNNCKYAFVMIDAYSRYPAVYPLRDMAVKGVTNSCKKFFSEFGLPDSVLTDQGAQFESHEFKSFLSDFKIKKLRTNSYHPAGNGLCERFNGVLKKSMLSYLTEKGLPTSQWTSSIHHVLFDYRSTPHTGTGARPFDLF